MVGKRWKFVKKTFNVLGMAKAAQPKSPSNNDNDDSHNSDVDVELEVRKPSSQPITSYERAKSKKDQFRRKKKVKADEKKEKAVKPKSRKILEEPDRLERARARREELQQFKKRTEEDIFLCKALGMDTNGMCLRHPNQLITTLGPAFDEVHRCRICDSESQVGSKAPRQRKSMANVIDQVKAMQANRDDWRKRTKVMFWTSKQGLDFDSDDDEALDEQFALTKEEWEEQVSARVTQVVAWRDENQLQAHPIFSRYFKMLDMGVPIEAARNACQMDGYNPVVLDLDPAKPLKTQIGKFDKKTRLEFEALADMKSPDNDDEEHLDVPELVTRVSVSFQKQMARDMLEAVQTIDALTEKAKKKKKSKAKGEKSKQRESASKEKKKETTTDDKGGDPVLESPKKKKTKRDSTKKDQKATKGESVETADKKKKRRSSKKSSSAKQGQEGSEDGTTGDNVEQAAKIEELNRTLEEKDKEIERLKEQLRQKDTIIQHLSKRTVTALRQKSNELGSPTRPSMSSSEHAVIAPMSDDDDTATVDDGLQAPNVEYQLPGYDFQTGSTNSTESSKESFVQDYVVPMNAGRKDHGENDGDESINSDAGSVPDVRDNTNVDDGLGDDDDKSSASDLITTEDDAKIMWLGRDDTLRTNPSHHKSDPDPKEKSVPETKDGNAGDGVETPPTGQELENNDSDEEEGRDDNDDTSNGSENDSESDNDENDDDDEEEVWLSDLEGEGTERSNDSDASDEEEQ